MIETEAQARSFVAERCDADAMALLERFVAALVRENSEQNLVSRASLEQVWLRHIADSAQLLDHVPRETSGLEGGWMDLGTGPGLPGLVLAIMRPDVRFILVESRKRRVIWLHEVAELLGLENVQIEGRRLEQVESFRAAAITARAFAPLPKLIDLSARFSTEATHWVLPKGRKAAQELQDMPDSVRSMFHVEQSLTDPDAGIIVGRLKKAGRARK